MSEQVAGDPQHFDTSLLLQLQRQVCYLIQVPIGLLQSAALRSHVPETHHDYSSKEIFLNSI